MLSTNANGFTFIPVFYNKNILILIAVDVDRSWNFKMSETDNRNYIPLSLYNLKQVWNAYLIFFIFIKAIV